MEDIIFKRRSIRLFKKQEIPEEILRKILLAGMWAPSPKNRQPWKIIAVLGKSKETMLPLMKEERESLPDPKSISPMQGTR